MIGPIFSYFRNLKEENSISSNIQSKNNINNSNKLNQMTIIVSIEKDQNIIHLFGKKFVENNENNCYLLIDGQKYSLTSSIKLNENQKTRNFIEIKLIESRTITDMSFLLCYENEHSIDEL